jgi:hypothetical protein
MKFNIDKKEYDRDQLTIDFSELNVIEKNYLDLLKKELPKEEEKADVK